MTRIKYAYFLLLALAVMFAFSITTRNNTFEDVDYLAFYSAGEIINEGDISRLYDLSYQPQIIENIRNANNIKTIGGTYPFINPPIYALFMSPLVKIPYFVSLNLWRIISIIIFLLCAYLLTKELNLTIKWYHVAVIGLVSYPAVIALKLGQNSFVSLSIYAVVYYLLKHNKDIPAGLILSIGFLKPQLFWCLPVVLIMLKMWKAFTGFFVGAIIFAAFNYFYFGSSVISNYISLLMSDTYREAWKPLQIYMHSIPSFFDLAFGVNLFIFAIITAVFVLFFIYRAIIQQYSFESIYAMTIIGTVIASPHLIHYDLLLLFIPCLIMFQLAKFNLFILVLFVLLWFSQFYIIFLPIQFSVIAISILFFLTKTSISSKHTSFTHI